METPAVWRVKRWNGTLENLRKVRTELLRSGCMQRNKQKRKRRRRQSLKRESLQLFALKEEHRITEEHQRVTVVRIIVSVSFKSARNQS